MRFELTAIILAMLLYSPNGSAEDSIADQARLNLSNELYGELAEEVESRLKDSGLSPAEVSERSEATADGYARCLVGFLQSQTDTEYSEMLSLMAEGMNELEVRTELGVWYTKLKENADAHKSEIEGCFMNVQQFLGIPGGLLFDIS